MNVNDFIRAFNSAAIEMISDAISNEFIDRNKTDIFEKFFNSDVGTIFKTIEYVNLLVETIPIEERESTNADYLYEIVHNSVGFLSQESRNIFIKISLRIGFHSTNDFNVIKGGGDSNGK